ncbi:MAG: glycosyltransferase family 39 protein [Anaerolineae bacterium]|nr:MAG: glycosyltransferase family 39 protein [Anaerolineae bacterium]
MNEKRFVALILILALVRGILYAIVIPLGQAPDEPTHFEYVKAVSRNLCQGNGDICVELRREIIASPLVGSNFDRYFYRLPRSILLSDTPPDIPGPDQFRHPPLYYWIGSVLLSPFSHHEIAFQAHALRMFSVILSTLTLYVVYLTAHEVFPNRWRLQIAVPLLLLFIPAHTFLSSTINNDRLAELLLSMQFYLWSRIFRRGLNWRRALSITALLGLGLWTKNTTVIGIPLAIMALAIHVWPKMSLLFTKLPWGRVVVPLSSAALLILTGLLVIAPNNAQGWNKTGIWNSQDDTHAYKGQHAIRVQSTKEQKRASVHQEISPSIWQSVAGKRVVLRAWVRTEKGEQTGSLQISASHQAQQTKFIASPEWTLQIVESVIPTDTQELGVQLGVHDPEGVLYFDDVQLVEDNLPTDSTQRESRNLLLNGSGEVSQWDIKPSVYHLMNDVLHFDVTPSFFGSLFDWQRSIAFREQYKTEFWILLTNFWASMGVRQVNPSQMWQWVLAFLGLISVMGVVLWIRREHHGKGDMETWQRRILTFFMIAAVSAIVTPFARMHPLPTPYYPHGRYIYVGIVPIVTLLVFGWREWIEIRFKIRHKTWLVAAGMVVGCLFDAMMLFDHAIPYFYGSI